MNENENDEQEDFIFAEVPTELKALRACLRCSLIKTFIQFHDRGCENCEFLDFKDNDRRVHDCTTSYFSGMISMIEPDGSWVAKWQRIGSFEPGMYAIEVLGTLPDYAQEICDSYGHEHRASVKAAK
jgi:transcription elongation factor SPT4